MSKIILSLIVIVGMIACSPSKSSEFGSYGEVDFQNENAIDVSQIANVIGDDDSLELIVQGTVSAVCQAKGCWMTMNIDEENELFVKFKDYGFLVPKNGASRDVKMKGWAYKTIISVKDLQEKARDENKTQEEIDAITEPEYSYVFVATGVEFLSQDEEEA
jgi:hypothetical protein